jgi:hypothetical protein
MATTQHPARTLSITNIRPAYYRNQTPSVAVHALTNELPGVALGTACGRVFGFANTAGLAIDAEPRPITCTACRAATGSTPSTTAEAIAEARAAKARAVKARAARIAALVAERATPQTD